MCANLFSSPKAPKVEKVAPPPQTISGAEKNAMDDRTAARIKKENQRKGYASTIVADDRGVLTDNAQGKQTLG